MGSQEAPRIVRPSHLAPKEGRERHISRLRSILERDGDHVSITDLDAANYLHSIKRLGVADAIKVSKSMHLITLYDPDNMSDRYVIDFVNSESALFADGMRRLKKVMHSFTGRRRR